MARKKSSVKEVQTVENAVITRSNKLVEARYRLSSVEQKIIYAVISMINPDDKDLFTYRFKIKDLADFCKLNPKSAYKQLEEATRTLRSRVLTLKKPRSTLQTGWINSAEYFGEDGFVEFELDWKLEPYLLQLKKEFTEIKTKELMSFKSQYSGRIYELVYQYMSLKGIRKISIEELKEYLGLAEKEYSLFSNIKARILEPAIKEITKKTAYNVTYETEKVGRKVTHIIFTITEKTKEPALPEPMFNEPDTVVMPEQYGEAATLLATQGISGKMIGQLLEQIEPSKIIKNVNHVLSMKNKPSSLTGAIVDACREDWAGLNEQAENAKHEEKKKAKEKNAALEAALLAEQETAGTDEEDHGMRDLFNSYKNKHLQKQEG